MTVSNTTHRVSYTGDGVTDTFAYTFRIFAESEIKVYVDGVLKSVNVHYTLTGVGETSGGDVIFTEEEIPANGALVILIRDLPLTQLTDYLEGDSFPAETHEIALDRLVMIFQQLKSRSLLLKLCSSYLDLELPEIEGGKVIGWNEAGSGLINYIADKITYPIDGKYVIDDTIEPVKLTFTPFDLDEDDLADIDGDLDDIADGTTYGKVSLAAIAAINNFFDPNVRKIWIYENAAPTGWVIEGVADRVLAVKGGTGAYNVAGGTEAGTWTQPDHKLTIAEMPSHTHYFGYGMGVVGGGKYLVADQKWGNWNSSSTGGNAVHNHGTEYRPYATVGIIIKFTGT